MKRIRIKKLLLLIIILLAIIPLVFWGSLKIVGGDDTRLYYFFPWEWIKNYGYNIISDTAISGEGYYFSLGLMIPLVLLIWLFKACLPFLNTEMLMLGINIALGFYFFYLMLGTWIKNEKSYDPWIKIASSLMYCLSTFVYFTIFGALWPAVFLLSVVPVCLYLFFKSLYDNNSKLAVLSATIFALFGNIIANVPWFLGLILTILPFLVFICAEKKKNIIKKIILFSVTFIVISFFALFHFFCAPIVASQNDFNLLSRVGSNKAIDIEVNENTIKAVSRSNQVLYPMFNLFHKGLQEDFGWKSLENYNKWSLRILPFNIIFIFIILLGFIYSRNNKNQKYRSIYLSMFVSWLLGLYLFTVNITGLGLLIFFFLNKYLPGFSMFRNMFDKFGLGMAFIYALLIAFSLKIVLDTVQKDKIRKYIIIIIILLVLLNSKSFILGENFKLSFRSMSSYDRINDFNKDFYALVDYVDKTDNPSKIAWIPLVIGNYMPIQDSKLNNNFYAGPSPIKILTNKNDFNGTYGFLGDGNILVDDLIMHKKYEEVGRFYQKKNIKYIIVNKNIPDDWKTSFLYTVSKPGDLYKAQDGEFRKNILGDKIQDFGNRYSLYHINPKYENEKLFLTDSENIFPEKTDNVQYVKRASYKYKVNLRLDSVKILNFLDPFHKMWKLYLIPSDSKNSNISFINKKSIFDDTHEEGFDYANSWRVDPNYIKSNYSKEFYKENSDGSIDVEFVLYFLPQTWGILAVCVSGLGLLISLLYIFGVLDFKNKFKRFRINFHPK